MLLLLLLLLRLLLGWNFLECIFERLDTRTTQTRLHDFMQVGTRSVEVESRNDFVPIQDPILTKVSGAEILLDSIEVLGSDFAMVVTLELGVLLGSWVWVFDRVFDLLARDFERLCDGYSGPFEVVVLAALDVS